jgi:hypothetical protein
MAGLTITVGGSDITAYVDVRSLSIEEVATGGLVATCRFSVRDHSGTVTIDEKDTVEIDDDGTTIFAGEVVECTDGQEGISKTWHVVCQDNNILLDETVVESESYEATVSDAFILGDATYGLFPQYRSDIDASTYVSTIDASMEAVEFVGMTLRECLDDLCRRTGGRYYVDYDKNLHYFATENNPAGFSLSTSPNGTTSFGFGGFKRVRSAARLANKVFVLGQEVSNWIADNDSIALYGERHAVSRDQRITTAQGITDRATAILDRYDLPRSSYELWTEKDGLRAGMSVTLVNATWGINSTFYIRRIRTEFLGWDGERRRYHLSLDDEQIEPAKSARQASLTIATIETEINSVLDTVFDTDAPAAPTLEAGNLTTDVDLDADGHQVVYLQVTWGAVGDSDLDHYLVQVSAAEEFSGYTLSRTHPAGGDRVERFVGLVGNTTYYVRVRAVDWVGNDSDWSTTRSTTTAKDETAPAQVADLVAAASRTLIGINWTANTEADLKHYEIQRAPDDSGAAGEYATIALARLNFYVDQDFTDEEIAGEDTFWYRVRAVDTSDNEGDWAVETSAALSQIASDHLAALSITTAKLAAGAVTAEKITVSQLSAIAADLGTITAGTVTGATIRTSASGARVVLDSTNGLQCYNSSDTLCAQIDVDGSGQIGASGGTTPPLTWNAAGEFQRIRANQLQIGESLFNTADGLLLLGPHCYISPTEWRSLRNQVATLSGAFHQVQGMWLGTRGFVLEEATTNLCPNPSFEVNVTDFWSTAMRCTKTRVTTDQVYGTACIEIVCNTNGESYVRSVTGASGIPVTAETQYAISGTIKVEPGSAQSAGFRVLWYNAAGTFISVTYAIDLVAPGRGWTKASAVVTSPALAAFATLELYQGTVCVSGDIAWFDGIQLEQKAYATSYCDGSLGYGYAWTGTAHNSTSTRTANECNLDAHIGFISGRNLVSYRLVCQAPYGATETWPVAVSTFMDAHLNTFASRVLIYFDPADDTIKSYLADELTNTTLESSAQTFVQGDWLDIVITLDYTNDSYNLYVNGVLEDTSTTALAAPTLDQWNLGSTVTPLYQTGAAFCEFAVFGKVLSSAEVSQLFELQQPLVDSGSMQAPGIYILDGRFRMASSSTGNRIEITADEVAGYNSAGTKQFYLRASDGVAACQAGSVTFGASGIDFDIGASYGVMRFLDGANIRGYFYVANASTPQGLWRVGPPAGAASTVEVNIQCWSQDLDYNDIRIFKSNTLGGVEIGIDGTVRTRWNKDGDLEIHVKDWVIVETTTSSSDGIRPETDETGYLGSGAIGWYEVNSKQFVDIGCLGCFDGGVELVDGQVVSDCEAVMRIRALEDGTLALCGVPKLNYSTLPKAVYRPVYDDDGTLIKDRAELTALISVMIGALRELIPRVEKLEAGRECVN